MPEEETNLKKKRPVRAKQRHPPLPLPDQEELRTSLEEQIKRLKERVIEVQDHYDHLMKSFERRKEECDKLTGEIERQEDLISNLRERLAFTERKLDLFFHLIIENTELSPSIAAIQRDEVEIGYTLSERLAFTERKLDLFFHLIIENTDLPPSIAAIQRDEVEIGYTWQNRGRVQGVSSWTPNEAEEAEEESNVAVVDNGRILVGEGRRRKPRA